MSLEVSDVISFTHGRMMSMKIQGGKENHHILGISIRLDYIYVLADIRDDMDQYGTIYSSHIELDHFPIWVTLSVPEKTEHTFTRKDKMRLSHRLYKEWEKWSKDMKTSTLAQKEEILSLLTKNNDLDGAVSMWTDLVTDVSLKHFRSSDSEVKSPYALALDDDTTLHTLNKDLRTE